MVFGYQTIAKYIQHMPCVELAECALIHAKIPPLVSINLQPRSKRLTIIVHNKDILIYIIIVECDPLIQVSGSFQNNIE